MPLVFTIEGDHSDLEWLRTRIDGAIADAIADAEDEERLDGEVVYGWEWEDDK